MRTLLSLAVACFLSAAALAQTPGLRWQAWPQGKPLPAAAVIAGPDSDGQALAVCRGRHMNSLTPGKTRSGKCNIAYGGREIELTSFEVLTGRGAWARPNRATGFVGGTDTDGTPLVVCRAAHQGSVTPGKVYRGQCNIAYGGREIPKSDFEVLAGR
jgi:hypothetical protein